ncbi:hypothetical protein [Jannaschia sp. LMIT008]|uniref:hypothetical protein n=1 Tax=Jannaschia maritima TaxID=3032585 RepID=UPI002810C76E|nr:hypothetical protein [Jannaschia sp. LMIT008]
MTADALFASPFWTAIALAALTYDNAILTYAILTWPEAATIGQALWKVAASLPWLLTLATPFAILFGLAGGWIARRAFAATRHRGRAVASLIALAAFLVPAALLTETALAWRDGWQAPRFALQVAGGALIAIVAAALLDWKDPHGHRR